MTTVIKPDAWADQFQAVIDGGTVSGQKIEVRPEQATFGQSVIDAFALKTPLIAECPVGTGKSLGYLIPLIHAVRGKEGVRGAVSTETLALQDQIALKDLPFLSKLYPGFTFRLLKGRSNYICLNNADYSTRGNAKMSAIYKELQARVSQLGEGEKRDAERIMKRELDEYTWSFLSGSSTFCAENGCSEPDKCFSARARSLALQADIVVVNHALLQTDADMKDGAFDADGLLGPLKYLVIDEAHTLETVLVDGWTETLSEWELMEMHGNVSKGVEKAASVVDVPAELSYKTETALDSISDSLDSVQRFYEIIHSEEEWRNVSTAMSEKVFYGTPEARVLRAMEDLEETTPARLRGSIEVLVRVQEVLLRAASEFEAQGLKGRREVKKGLRSAKALAELCEMIIAALGTKDGIVMRFGMPTGVIVNGFVRKDGRHGVRLQMVPLDISGRAKRIWNGLTPILVSATLSDLTDGSFRYLKTSLGFPDCGELRTGSPFNYATQQLVYITPAKQETFESAMYSFQELVDVVNAADGRSLILFTSRGELDAAAEALRQYRAAGMFEHPILVQEKDTNKQKLADDFRQVNSSVLLATRSFFTGVDFPGDTCSLVAICRFTLRRFDVLTRMLITWWRSRGFPTWYEREALTTWQQACGRLIRSGTDRGVVAVLDQRVVDPGQRVYQTARIGVEALKSPITRNVDDVRTFLAA